MNITCGIFLFNNRSELLIVHPTFHPKNIWSIPKGSKESSETSLQAAIRELKEETLIDLDSSENFIDLGEADYKWHQKSLHAFILKSNNSFDNHEFKCTSLFNVNKDQFPEVDDFKWTRPEDAIPLIHITQQLLLKKYLSNK